MEKRLGLIKPSTRYPCRDDTEHLASFSMGPKQGLAFIPGFGIHRYKNSRVSPHFSCEECFVFLFCSLPSFDFVLHNVSTTVFFSSPRREDKTTHLDTSILNANNNTASCTRHCDCSFGSFPWKTPMHTKQVFSFY